MALAACTSPLSNSTPTPAATPPAAGGQPSRPAPVTEDCSDLTSSRSPLRRLTRFEYDNTVRDLLGDDTRSAESLPPEPNLIGFDTGTDTLATSRLLVGMYAELAYDLAERAASHMPGWFSCDAVQLGSAVCGEELVRQLGQRAYRRPLAPDENTRLLAVFTGAAGANDFAAGAHALIETVLQAPQFLYRLELDVPGVALPRPVNAWQLATRLSYTLWGSMPDDELTRAAGAGELDDPAQVGLQAARMLSDPKARPQFQHFSDQWLDLTELSRLEKDDTVFPTYRPELRQLWRQETHSLLENVIFDQDAGTELLLTAPFTFVNDQLAAFYGLPPVVGSDFRQVAAGPHRSGLLTQASILASQAKANRSEPIYRGVFVRALMCQPTPDPPNNVPPAPEVAGPSTGRERLEAHRAAPQCAACHRLFDPIGLAFENYDGVGLYRDTEQGKSIDASGDATGTDIEGSFTGVAELSQKLVGSKQFHDCIVSKWFTFGYGRTPEPADVCTLRDLGQRFATSGYRIRELVKQLALSKSFRTKYPATLPEAL